MLKSTLACAVAGIVLTTHGVVLIDNNNLVDNTELN